MKASSILFLAIAFVLVSCAPQYARMVRDDLDEPYAEARQRLDEFYQSHDREFSLLKDELKTRSIETIPGKQTEYVTTRWAMDIGSHPEFEAILTSNGHDSLLIAKELRDPRQIYDGTRLFSGNKLGNLSSLDRWVRSHMRFKSNYVGEDKESPPLYPNDDVRF